jgi:tetraacyldisaccharide 4'-kinase
MYRWFEQFLFYKETTFQQILSALLFPLGIVFASLAIIKRLSSRAEDMNIPIISIGNISMGGNGKTPLTISIARAINEPVAIILRGYKRESKGLLQVSLDGKILTDCSQSGDEAMLMADRMPFANVIVSEDRKKAINLAKTQNIKYILLDDGFSKASIKKYDILVQGEEDRKINKNPIPSGCYREFAFCEKYADKIAIEGLDFYKKVHFPSVPNTPQTTLITSISKPNRLDKYLPSDISKQYFSDHHPFCIQDIEKVLQKYNTKILLMTKKDWIKIKELDMSKWDIKIEIIYLEVKISDEFKNELMGYINGE